MEVSDLRLNAEQLDLELGTELIELDAAETEDGLLSTPVHDVFSCIGDTLTPVRCVVESDYGQYEDVLDHPEQVWFSVVGRMQTNSLGSMGSNVALMFFEQLGITKS